MTTIMPAKVYCLIGHPVAHSVSPQMMNAAFKAVGIDAEYVLEDISAKDLGEFMQTYSAKFAGGNVTVPYKEAIMQYLDEIDETARNIGAVNVIVNRGGKLFGTNTDWIGALRALEEGMNSAGVKTGLGSAGFLAGKTVMILGAGGAAKAMAYGASRAAAEIIVLNRTSGKAAALAEKYSGTGGALGAWEKFSPDIIVNCTSIGFANAYERGQKTSESPLPAGAFQKWARELADVKKLDGGAQQFFAMDMGYKAGISKFLQDAQKAGWKIIKGDRMLIHQGAEAFTIWTGKKAPLKAMEKALASAL